MNTLKKKKPRLLTDLQIEEISLVDKGASPGAKVLLYKRAIDKTVHAPSDLLGINLLRVLTNRVDNVKQDQNITRIEAWMEVLQSEEGKQLLELITKMKNDPSLISKDMEDSDLSELADFIEGPHLDAFVKAFKKEIKKGIIVPKEMETVQKIFKKSFGSQIEAMDSLKLELNKRAAGDDKRTAEQRLVNYIDNHPDLESAIRELPNVVKVEVQEKPDFGPTYREIEKLAAELVIKGVVPTQEQGVVKIVKDNPGLYLQYLEEQV